MTPKEKAEELINRYLKVLAGGMYNVREEAKICALVAVDEINKYVDDSKMPYPYNEYWDNVKQEIENF